MSSQPSCTILTTSSSITLARSLVARIIEHATGAPSAHDGDADSVAWMIDNKYYTAPVHFSIHATSTVDAAEPGPPALVYVFAKGKPFRDEFAKLQPALAEHDFEVTLAAAVRADSAVAHAEEDDADAFFREHGFELVDGDAAPPPDAEDGAGGVPRIVDALSTILWPSMARKGAQRASRLGPSIVVGAGAGDDDALLSFLAGAGGPLHGAPRGGEMAALERWLEEDDDGDGSSTHHEAEIASPVSAGGDGGLVPPHRAWTHFPSGSSTSLASPVAPRPPVPAPSASSFAPSSSASTPHAGSPTGAGFEDDFADFVGAPASESSFSFSTPDHGYNALLDSDDDDDQDLPSRAEIRSTSERIFGPEAGDDRERDPDFDIAHAFSALQAMRDEIGAISDDAERRRAAARVALGFAYGLDLGNEGPERKAKE